MAITILADQDFDVTIESKGVTTTDEPKGRYNGDITLAAKVGKGIELDKNKEHTLQVGTGEEVTFQPTAAGTLVIANSGALKTDYRFFEGGTFEVESFKVVAKKGDYPAGTTEVVVQYSESGKTAPIATPSAKLAGDDSINAGKVAVEIGREAAVEATGAGSLKDGEVKANTSALMVNPFDDNFAAEANGIAIAKAPKVGVSVTITPTDDATAVNFAVTSTITP